MSSTAPLRNRLPYVAPRVAQAALERARLTVVPRRRSFRNRCPCVDMASRSTRRVSARRMSSVAGSPIASSVDTVRPLADSSDASRSR